MTVRETSTIGFYHAHVYYNAETKPVAERLRERLAERFEVELGRWHDRNVGPHPRWSYQVKFDTGIFAELVPWLMLNREGLTVFLHPNTGDDIPDHRDFPLWLGEGLGDEIDLETLK